VDSFDSMQRSVTSCYEHSSVGPVWAENFVATCKISVLE
jgi:hypothetical protein